MNQKGFTLIETLIGSAIFVVIALSAYQAFGLLMDSVAASKAKLAATALANERFEIIRNMPYDDVGILGGLPVGKIVRTENIVRDNHSFTVETTIRSLDDPFDSTIEGDPADLSPADYKLADLDITCSDCKIFSPIKFTTIVAPHALETASNNGALFIQVFDANGTPIPSASVHIVNTETNPDTIIDETTDNTGWIKIVDAPTGINAYNITATKSGYTQDETYPLGGTAGADPIKPDSTVVLQEVTQITFSIDRVSSLAVETLDSACEALPNISFSLTGTKHIGNPDILKYPTQNFTTNASGDFSLSNVEWDTYSALLTSAALDLAGTNPLPSFAINPNESRTLQLIAVPHVNKALLVSVKDAADVPIDGATVRLEGASFDETKTTNNGTCTTPGQVFWNGLSGGPHTLTVSKAGYQDSIVPIDVTEDWQNQNVILEP
jgi:prepilin-type N-terminal cleavage/methylation domain-containing protein